MALEGVTVTSDAAKPRYSPRTPSFCSMLCAIDRALLLSFLDPSCNNLQTVADQFMPVTLPTIDARQSTSRAMNAHVHTVI